MTLRGDDDEEEEGEGDEENDEGEEWETSILALYSNIHGFGSLLKQNKLGVSSTESERFR